MVRRILLACGVLASLMYAGTDVLAAIFYGEYHSFTSRVVSELMASGAPTEQLVDPLFLLYGVLMMAFGVGVWMSDPRKRVHIAGGLLFAYAALGLLGPTVFEMNVRGAGGNPTADVLHIAITGVLTLVMFAAMGFGASIRGRSFHLYTYATAAIMLVFGVVTSFMAPGLDGSEPTPWVGLMERISIAAFLLWVVVLTISLWRVQGTADVALQSPTRRMPRWALAAK